MDGGIILCSAAFNCFQWFPAGCLILSPGAEFIVWLGWIMVPCVISFRPVAWKGFFLLYAYIIQSFWACSFQGLFDVGYICCCFWASFCLGVPLNAQGSPACVYVNMLVSVLCLER